jgi:hypothetical protein
LIQAIVVQRGEEGRGGERRGKEGGRGVTGTGGASFIQALVVRIDQQALGHMQVFENSSNSGGRLRIRCPAYKPCKKG